MTPKLNRQWFCALTGLSSTNLDNRTRANQLALAFGLQTPAVVGEYHQLDVFANALADALVERGFARETAVSILREHHEVWLAALTHAEWSLSMWCQHPSGEITMDKRPYFAIARDGRGKGEAFRAAAGSPDRALEELLKGGAADMWFINMLDVLYVVIDAFDQNGVRPEKFTRHRSHPEFPEWREEIARYRQQSIDRVKTRERVRKERVSAVRQAAAKRERERA